MRRRGPDVPDIEAQFDLPIAWSVVSLLRQPLPPPPMGSLLWSGWERRSQFTRYPHSTLVRTTKGEPTVDGRVGDGDWNWLARALRWAMAVGSGDLVLRGSADAWITWSWTTHACVSRLSQHLGKGPLWTEGAFASGAGRRQWWPSRMTESTLLASVNELRSGGVTRPQQLRFAYRGRNPDEVAAYLRDPSRLPGHRTEGEGGGGWQQNEILGYCRRCNRPLSDPFSAEIGLGPTCAEHEGYWFR